MPAYLDENRICTGSRDGIWNGCLGRCIQLIDFLSCYLASDFLGMVIKDEYETGVVFIDSRYKSVIITMRDEQI